MLSTRKALSPEVIKELSLMIENEKLTILAGSGISVDSGLPTWDKLLEDFIEFCSDFSKSFKDQLPDFLLLDSRMQRSINPAKVASVLKKQLEKIPDDSDYINRSFRIWFIQNFTNKIFNINHEHIVKTNYPIIMTSNYDTLIEDAAKRFGIFPLALNTVSFGQCSLIAKYIYEKIDCIIHIHGIYEGIALKNVVFSYDDYVNIMKNKPGFRMAIETIFIMNSILFVGYGMSDPHLEDLIEEITINLDFASNKIKKFFIVVLESKIKPVIKLFKESQGVELITIENYSELTTFLKNLRDNNPRN